MTHVLYTVDTELSVGMHARGADLETNLAWSIFGRCRGGSFGIEHQAGRLNAHGLKGVFFVDPMPGAVFGVDAIKRIVAPILEAGHEVQLHIHTEWLPYMPFDPVDGRRSDNICDFEVSDQRRLLELAMELLTAAGAPVPIAFRAGNYGADDRTLTALASLGLRYDTSFNPAYLGDACHIGLPSQQVEPIEHLGVTVLPVSCILERPGRLRHVQLCALSSWEMRDALDCALAERQQAFTIVSHSFELLSRDRQRANRVIVDRFEAMCRALADRRMTMPTAGFAGLALGEVGAPARLKPNPLRTTLRLGEQVISTLRYDRASRPPLPAPASTLAH